MTTKIKQVAPIAFVTLFAALVRIPGLDAPLVGDQVFNFTWHSFTPWKELLFEYTEANQHTLFVALARLSMKAFGESEIAFLLPVLLAGVFSVPLLYNITLFFFNFQRVAATASFLLVFSFEPVFYSQHGRSYSLTMFLTLAMIYVVIKIIENKSAWWLKHLVLPVLGLCMALALPSNANVLAAVTLFFVIAKWDGRVGIKNYFNAAFLKELVPFGIAFLLVVSYFLTIRTGLKRALDVYIFDKLEFSMEWVTKVSSFLVEPWGLWLYLFFAYGLFVFKRDSRFFAFLSIFLVPFTLTFISKTFGPPRIYIYWLPFVMMVVALGLVRFVDLMSTVLIRASAPKVSNDLMPVPASSRGGGGGTFWLFCLLR